jgi:hypothetical protein
MGQAGTNGRAVEVGWFSIRLQEEEDEKKPDLISVSVGLLCVHESSPGGRQF